MFDNDDPEEFAFGDNEMNGRPCPVRSIGEEVSGHALNVAETYDEEARQRANADEGTLPRSVAQECWDAAVVHFEQLAEDTDDPREEEMYVNIATEGREIARRAF